MKIALSCCAALALLAQTAAYACTPEEATAKAEQLAAKIAEITQQDPKRAAELRQELKETSPQTSSQVQDECHIYDLRLQELDKAAKHVEG